MQKYDLHSAAFPALSEAEMASLGSCPLTVLKKYKPEEKLPPIAWRQILKRQPELGDIGVRSGSIKRVGSAVGEGAVAVQFVHEYMKDM